MRCNFCGEDYDRDIVSNGGVDGRNFAICKRCVTYCSKRFSKKRSFEDLLDEAINKYNFSMKDIKSALDEAVVGQERAKRALTVAVCNHYKRTWSGKKSNVLMIGPTGSGKTLIVKTIANAIGVPCVIADCSQITQAGYIGSSVEDVISQLCRQTDDLDAVEHGIVFLDEVDKIATKNDGRGDMRDPTGEGVQQCLLKVMEGCDINLRSENRMYNKTINTDNMLFICSGAFPGIKERSKPAKMRPAGFCREEKEEVKKCEKITVDDVVNYGFLPEFVGRLPVIVELEELKENDLVDIIKRHTLNEYEEIFSQYDVKLSFSDEAIKRIAKNAIKNNTGARGVRGVIENVLQDAMFDVGMDDGYSRCVVDENLDVKLERNDILEKET